MPNVLVVEDDGYKSDHICAILDQQAPKPKIKIARSVSEAVAAIGAEAFDFIVLDMSLPSHPVIQGGGSPLSLPVGGLEVLFELQSLGRKDPCIILTQFHDIEMCGTHYPLRKASKAISDNYGVTVLACVPYTVEGKEWQAQIVKAYKTTCIY